LLVLAPTAHLGPDHPRPGRGYSGHGGSVGPRRRPRSAGRAGSRARPAQSQPARRRADEGEPVDNGLGTVNTLLVYGAMACYVVAMVAFAVDVSALGAGARSRRRRRAAGIGMSVTHLAAGVQLVAIVLRGLAAGRVPWANMYEFTLMFTFFL